MADKEPAIKMPDMCDKHQYLLVHQARYSKRDPWQALIIAAQIALFQAAMTHKRTHDLTGGDVNRLSELGCLACYRPDAFGEIVEEAKSHDLKRIKALGEGWTAVAAAQGPGWGT